jgi:aminoglycoside phosphotransferase (APT) family kinase protein
MPEIEDKNLERLVQRIDPKGRLLRTWQLKGGASAQMTAIEVGRLDGQTKKLIVRQPGKETPQQNPHAARNEFRLLQILHSAGLAVPMPYHLVETNEIFTLPCLVVEYIEGDLEFAPSNLADFTFQLAAQLARIHHINRSDTDLAFLAQEATGFAEELAGQRTTLDKSIDEARIRKKLQSLKPYSQWNETVLLHGDFWPGNVLWKDAKLVAVIDWEDAHLGDPLMDVAISRLDILLIFGVKAMTSFTNYYQSMNPINFTNLPYWDLYAALRAAPHLNEWATIYPLLGRNDITERTIREAHSLFITQAFENLPTG